MNQSWLAEAMERGVRNGLSSTASRALASYAARQFQEHGSSIAGELGLTADQLMADRSHLPLLVRARARVYRALRTLGWSYPQIGRACGRDHTVVMMALRKWRDQ